MLPSEKTLKWQQTILNFDAENFQIIETKNEIEEAKIIAEILSEQKKSALVTNNKSLAKLVRLELKRQSIPFNDARNLDIFDSQLINFLLLIFPIENRFNFCKKQD
jgi:inactivated superfamily I helicase